MDPAQITQDSQQSPVPPLTGPQPTPVISPTPPPVPVGGKKEADIWAQSNQVAKEEGDEYWESYAREIELEKEIEEMGGIEKVEAGEVKIPAEVAKEMGVTPVVGPQTPMAVATGFSVRGVSLTDDQLTTGRSSPTSTGIRWLVEWFIFQLLRAHFFVKKIKGKIVREKVASVTI